MVLNEAFCLAVGRHMGVSVAGADVLRIPDPILVVERYDRHVEGDGRIRRVHQEDMAQALGAPLGACRRRRGEPWGSRTPAACPGG